jgi:hypothetical protein
VAGSVGYRAEPPKIGVGAIGAAREAAPVLLGSLVIVSIGVVVPARTVLLYELRRIHLQYIFGPAPWQAQRGGETSVPCSSVERRVPE